MSPAFFSSLLPILSSPTSATRDPGVSGTHSLARKNYAKSSTSSSPYPGHRFPREASVWGMCQKLAPFSCLPSSSEFEVVPELVSHGMTQNHLKIWGKKNTSGLMKAVSQPKNTPWCIGRYHSWWHWWQSLSLNDVFFLLHYHLPRTLAPTTSTTQFSVQ
jgi:hypothetical protein